MPRDDDLAAFRRRLDETLEARRAATPRPVALGAARRTAPDAAASRPAMLTACLALLGIAGSGAAGVLAWPLLPDRPALVEAREALAAERARNRQLAAELMATWRTLKAQSMALADHDGRERQVEALRDELRQAGEIAAAREHFLADAQDRIRQLEAQLDAQPEAASGPAEAKPRVERAAVAAPAVADSELPRLMTRARLLLGQGDIGGARTVLERAAASGNALVLFALAETFDPGVLSRWGTQGTRGDVARAQALYEQARAAGVDAAADRLAALR